MEYSQTNLLLLLQAMIDSINKGDLTEAEQRDIWGSLVWDKKDPDVKKFMKYVFTGWWIHENLENKNILCPNNNESKPISRTAL